MVCERGDESERGERAIYSVQLQASVTGEGERFDLLLDVSHLHHITTAVHTLYRIARYYPLCDRSVMTTSIAPSAFSKETRHGLTTFSIKRAM